MAKSSRKFAGQSKPPSADVTPIRRVVGVRRGHLTLVAVEPISNRLARVSALEHDVARWLAARVPLRIER